MYFIIVCRFAGYLLQCLEGVSVHEQPLLGNLCQFRECGARTSALSCAYPLLKRTLKEVPNFRPVTHYAANQISSKQMILVFGYCTVHHVDEDSAGAGTGTNLIFKGFYDTAFSVG